MSEPDGEVLTGPGLPRWVLPLVVIAVGALIIGLAVTKIHGDGDDSARPSGSATPGVPSELGGGISKTTPERLPFDAPVDAVATDGSAVWALQQEHLVRQADGVTRVIDTFAGPGSQLVLDVTERLVWVVTAGSRPMVFCYRAASITPIMSVPWPRAITAATALAGGLFVADSTGVSRIDIADHVSSRSIEGERVLTMTADPFGKRVVIVTSTAVYTLDKTVLSSVGATPDAVTHAALAVTGSGQLWAAGRRGSVAAVVRLDPRTFDTAQVATAQNLLGVGGNVLLAAGATDVLVGNATDVWCVDGTYGLTREHWQIQARALAVSGRLAYAATDDGLVRLDMGASCRG